MVGGASGVMGGASGVVGGAKSRSDCHHTPSIHQTMTSHSVSGAHHMHNKENCITPSNSCHGYPVSSVCGIERDGTAGLQGVDIDHLAWEVREKLADIFD